ncbi:MAG TPA: hypothetical protein VH764_03560 [Gemmatimonadales bacterium]|jgi:hypothetical protein
MIGSGMMASALCSTALLAQAPASADVDVCELVTEEEFQKAQGVDPRIGIIPNAPVLTDMSWGPHCDYSDGSIDLFTKESDLERVLELTKAVKRRDAVQGLGQRAYFTIVYPGDEYRQRGLLAIFLGPRILTLTMDDSPDVPVAATRPKLEGLAKLAVPRLK